MKWTPFKERSEVKTLILELFVEAQQHVPLVDLGAVVFSFDFDESREQGQCMGPVSHPPFFLEPEDDVDEKMRDALLPSDVYGILVSSLGQGTLEVSLTDQLMGTKVETILGILYTWKSPTLEDSAFIPFYEGEYRPEEFHWIGGAVS